MSAYVEQIMRGAKTALRLHQEGKESIIAKLKSKYCHYVTSKKR
jgi:hypothetical protein